MLDTKLIIYNNFDDCKLELDKFKKYKETKNPFLQVEWLKLWWQHFGDNKHLYLIIFYDSDRIVGFAPLFYLYKPIIGVYEFKLIGDGFSSYLDIIVEEKYEDRIINSLISHLQTNYKNVIISFNDINNRFSHIFHSLKKKVDKKKGYVALFKLYPCPLAELEGNWDSYFKSRGDHRSRYNLRKRLERVSKNFGELKFYELSNKNDRKDIGHLIEEIEKIHRERFIHTLNPLFSKYTRNFIFSFLKKYDDYDASLSIVELDKIPISFLIGFRMGDIFVDFAPGFDPAFATFGLGNIHLMKLIELKCTNNIKVFDFSKGEAEYKRWWSNDETYNYLIKMGLNLNIAGLYFFKINEAILKLKIYLRENGYNTMIKTKFADIKNRLIEKDKNNKNEISINEIQLGDDKFSYLNNKSFENWSYRKVIKFPVKVRETMLKLITKNKIEDIVININELKKEIIIGNKKNKKKFLISYQ